MLKLLGTLFSNFWGGLLIASQPFLFPYQWLLQLPCPQLVESLLGLFLLLGTFWSQAEHGTLHFPVSIPHKGAFAAVETTRHDCLLKYPPVKEVECFRLPILRWKDCAWTLQHQLMFPTLASQPCSAQARGRHWDSLQPHAWVNQAPLREKDQNHLRVLTSLILPLISPLLWLRFSVHLPPSQARAVQWVETLGSSSLELFAIWPGGVLQNTHLRVN